MTPEQWFTANNPESLLAAASDFGRAAAFDRRRRLFACACARHVWHLLATDARSAVQVSERLADGRATLTDLRAAAVTLPELVVTAAESALASASWASAAFSYWAQRRPAPSEQLQFDPWEAARHAARAVATERVGSAPTMNSRRLDAWHDSWTRVYDEARATQAAFVRDIFPPPEYTPRLEPAWVTAAVAELARQMDESGDFSAVPILADALQDAGCEDETVLQCCRAPGPVHVRGNWVVDLVLGR
jgi:hypothetical protein